MGARVLGVASIALACGCALVSGLSNLEVVDGSSGDASTNDALGSDVPISDSSPPQEAASGGRALATSGGCAASNATVSLSNLQFTVTLWLRVDAFPTSDQDVLPIIWNGGRAPSEQGWSLDLTNKGVTFCVSDQNGSTCTPSYAIQEKHLVHVALVSPYTGLTSGRTLTMYAMDQTAGATMHTQVATASNAQGNWSTSAPLTVGGAQVGVSCTSPSTVTVDRLHIHDAAVPVGTLDTTVAMNVCSGQNVLADYEMDEPSGVTAQDCITKTVLSWGPTTKVGLVISPFP